MTYMVFISESAEETLRIASGFAKTLKPNDAVLLNGEMGAGKTLFTKGIVKGLGNKSEVLSPTYTYMNDYGGVYHFDFYRMSRSEQAEALGLCDYFYAGGICIIEWGENVKEVLPQKVKTVNIKIIGDGRREIEYE